MRLLNTHTLKLEDFTATPQEPRPPYTILSHTWGAEEVTMQGFEHKSPEVTRQSGYRKIENCCMQSRRDGFHYTWIDTCCINKESSSELSEAINSMYEWYAVAAVCYVYLSDVETSDMDTVEEDLIQSRWLTRGWTLQELLAPKSLIFFSAHWIEIGSSLDYDLMSIIHKSTRIPMKVLVRREKPQNYSVAQRMSWAADRQTKRTEDRAYSLLGIFDICMPLIYGEGRKAFWRLQQEIIAAHEDMSIFAWAMSREQEKECPSGVGVLAEDPCAFRYSRNISRTVDYADSSFNQVPNPFLLNHVGVFITADFYQCNDSSQVELQRILAQGLWAMESLGKPLAERDSVSPDRIAFAILHCRWFKDEASQSGVILPLCRTEKGTYRRLADIVLHDRKALETLHSMEMISCCNFYMSTEKGERTGIVGHVSGDITAVSFPDTETSALFPTVEQHSATPGAYDIASHSFIFRGEDDSSFAILYSLSQDGKSVDINGVLGKYDRVLERREGHRYGELAMDTNAEHAIPSSLESTIRREETFSVDSHKKYFTERSPWALHYLSDDAPVAIRPVVSPRPFGFLIQVEIRNEADWVSFFATPFPCKGQFRCDVEDQVVLTLMPRS
ncbi:hypothetical protein MKZ38_005042 [Zalerion maritima]|uniref:Heterokaryon incompatibility domain-containing protein n=1 Tax=Zalerion maritima TaxID=339359 RepID=A0AAD5WQJ6_9PEZI|nr:hypothetical protein MKZ38_005042 [Zalerion maritima]